MFANLFQAFTYHVRTRPRVTALVADASGVAADPPSSFTWGQLAAAVAVVAEDLRSLADGEAAHCPIGHTSDNSLGDVVVALATMMIGAIEVPLDARLSQSELQNRWNRVGGFWLNPDRREELMRRAVRQTFSGEVGDLLMCESSTIDDPSLILWTSGTTGRPQGVTQSQRNLCGNAAAKLKAVPQNTQDVRLCVLPLSHAYARTCDIGTWLLSGCTLGLSLGFEGWNRMAPLLRPTHANTVPSLAQRLLESQPERLGLDRLKTLGCGGAAMSEASFVRWKERGVTVIQGYGLTETSPVICSATPNDAIPGHVGRFVDGWEHQLRDGRLLVRGPHVMLGYWNDPEATSEKIDDEDWLDTGDLVEIDPDSAQLRILGRADDVLVLDSGRKFHPHEIEKEVERLLGVRHAMLTVREGSLELWLDADRLPDLDPVFHDRPGWQTPRVIERFDPALSQQDGELTSKGTLRRHRIIETRFGSAPAHTRACHKHT